ncbi:hypothetical protein HYX19_04950 [Candidatus Woesearchaeota archaeon]|nr:hypothetical protein [Candidatus Woesearchaeota archaeon]
MTRIISAINDEELRRSMGRDYGNYVFMPQHGLYVAKERSHFNKDWYESHNALHSEGARMLTLREFADFLILLRNGDDEFQKTYKDITEEGNQGRAEWLDADFKVINGVLHINYNHRAVNGELKPQNSEPLESCLMEDCNVNLTNFNRQGLPTKKGVDFFYLFPRQDNNSVVRFGTNSVGAYLYCNVNPRDLDASIGVRAAKLKE